MPQNSITMTLIAAAYWELLRSPEWLTAFGDDEERVALLLEKLCDTLDGPRTVYIPDSSSVRASIERLQRDISIRDAFNGQNHEDLAQQYRMSPRQVRRIVAPPHQKK